MGKQNAKVEEVKVTIFYLPFYFVALAVGSTLDPCPLTQVQKDIVAKMKEQHPEWRSSTIDKTTVADIS